MEWINPNDKSQKKFLPWIGEECLFAHDGKTYFGVHTGGSFKTGQGVAARHFPTWNCVWMPIPQAPSRVHKDIGIGRAVRTVRNGSATKQAAGE